ncbi:MAG: anhydro-N-acetylmuramic acid kinase [Alphaproteobacteria bacterium]|nr:anhydro-N-acetylmuramic acid kinase [Alphaproteobacteria bacterium]
MTLFLRAIGVISGTSMDAIDVALIETDGAAVRLTGIARSYPYAPELRNELIDFLKAPERAELDPLTLLESNVTDAHVAAVELLVSDFNLDRSGISLVGMHGQTVYHRPERRFTRQLLDGARAARQLGIDVVARFRDADIAAGGQGAPLAPLYHRALCEGLDGPVIVLNLGGVANVTYISDSATIAFDTGPASALLDDFVRRRTGAPFDEGGKLASIGRIDEAFLTQMLGNPFFARRPPKSLDRNDFHAMAEVVDGLSDADGAATLSAFTVAATCACLRHLPERPKRWLVTGGGRHNRTFMEGFRRNLGVAVEPVETVGWNGDALEAELFGFLAVRSVKGMPLSLPSTTGVPSATTGGVLFSA